MGDYVQVFLSSLYRDIIHTQVLKVMQILLVLSHVPIRFLIRYRLVSIFISSHTEANLYTHTCRPYYCARCFSDLAFVL